HQLERRIAAVALLPHGLDRHIVMCERLRDVGEDTGLVSDVEADVVAGKRLAHWPDAQCGVRRVPHPTCPGEPVACDRDDVAEHSARGWCATRTPTVEHQLAGGLGFDEDG